MQPEPEFDPSRELPDHGSDEPASVNPPAQVPAKSPAAPAEPQSNTVTTILEWLTYAFWSWTSFTIVGLIAVATYMITHAQRSNDEDLLYMLSFGIGGAIVLAAISFICDVLFSRRETQHKQKAMEVIMVIYAVAFALTAVGGLLWAVFYTIYLFIGRDPNVGDAAATVYASAISLLVLQSILFVRTFAPFKFAKLRSAFRYLMIALTVLVTIFGIVGPLTQSSKTKNDSAVTGVVPLVVQGVDIYLNDNDQLPANINTALNAAVGRYGLSGLTKAQQNSVDNSLVTYRPNIKNKTTIETETSTRSTYYYELCATYRVSQNTASSYSSRTPSTDGNGYIDSLDAYDLTANAKAGKTCYKLKTTTTDQQVKSSDGPIIQPYNYN